MYFQMDGEPEFGGEKVTIKVVPKGLKVFIPDQTPGELFDDKGKVVK